MGKADSGKSAVAAPHTKHAAAATTTTTIKSVPSYHDRDGNIHFPALKSMRKHFLDQGVFHIWRCGRCTSRNAAESTDCGGCGCGHRRCGKDCEWLVKKGPEVKKLAAAATQGNGSGLQQQQQQRQKAGFDEAASGASGAGERGAAATITTTGDDDDDDGNNGVYPPSPPDETEGQGDVNIDVGVVATVTFLEQTQYWICCYCGKDDNPAAAASCSVALCGHIRGAPCATRWVDG